MSGNLPGPANLHEKLAPYEDNHDFPDRLMQNELKKVVGYQKGYRPYLLPLRDPQQLEKPWIEIQTHDQTPPFSSDQPNTTTPVRTHGEPHDHWEKLVDNQVKVPDSPYLIGGVVRSIPHLPATPKRYKTDQFFSSSGEFPISG